MTRNVNNSRRFENCMVDYGYPPEELVRIFDKEIKFASIESAVKSDRYGRTDGPESEKTAIKVQLRHPDGTLAEKMFLNPETFRNLIALYGVSDLNRTYAITVIAVYDKRTRDLESLLPLIPNSTLQTRRQQRLEERLPS